MPQLYTVRPGDTLTSIARETGTTVQSLMELNQIADPNMIFPGQTLLISVEGVNGGEDPSVIRCIDGLLYILTTDRGTY
ncbi:MAG: LysM peptidoglycan-binding domain-containing protein, partial [Desulfocucumaceae bacterium]